MAGLRFSYDANTDVMEIEGIKYAGSLFRALGDSGLAVGARLEITSREDGVITFRRWYSVPEPEYRQGMRVEDA